ncbi:MAG: hypothetical protein ACXU86_17645 [Archangium sp.]
MTNTGTTSRLRTLLTLVASALFLVMLLAFGARWKLNQRSHAAGDVLVAEARALTLASERVTRPPHTDEPLPGTLAEALGPLMPEVVRLYDSQPKPPEPVSQACAEVREGKRPLAELPRECREALEQGRPLMQRVLRTSRAEAGGLPEGLRALDDPHHPNQRVGMVALQNILKLAALDIRFQLEAGQADAALETCLDGLALARDLAAGSTLLGAMVSAAGHGILFPPCSEALNHASLKDVQRAEVALRHIREGQAPLSSALRYERVYMPLAVAGWQLDRGQLEALPAGARALATQNLATLDIPPVVGPLLLRHAWLKMMELTGQAMPLMDLPAAQRSARLAAVAKAAGNSLNPLLRMDWPDYERYAARADKQRAQLDLLLALAVEKVRRGESRVWPEPLPPLYEREVLLPTALKLQPAEGGVVRIIPEAADLQELAVTPTP